jgi:hypothetical protein
MHQKTRGWAFQERLLSERYAVFTKEEIWWECHQGFACECSGIWSDILYNSRLKLYTYYQLTNSYSLDDIQRCWEILVTEHTCKNLTYEADIFQALQGLAKALLSKMGAYLAGH